MKFLPSYINVKILQLHDTSMGSADRMLENKNVKTTNFFIITPPNCLLNIKG